MLLWFCGLLHGLYFWQLRRIACYLLVSVGCSEGRHFLNSNPVGTATRTSSASFSWLELSFWTSARLWATRLAINPSVSLENVRPFWSLSAPSSPSRILRRNGREDPCSTST
jgi:hypothetical protein